MSLKAYDEKGRELRPGDPLKLRQASQVTFLGVENEASPGKSARVRVRHLNGNEQVFYDRVFGLYVRDTGEDSTE